MLRTPQIAPLGWQTGELPVAPLADYYQALARLDFDAYAPAPARLYKPPHPEKDIFRDGFGGTGRIRSETIKLWRTPALQIGPLRGDSRTYADIEKLQHRTPTDKIFEGWTYQGLPRYDITLAARLAYESGTFLQAALCCEETQDATFAAASEMIRESETRWLEVCQLFELKEDASARRQQVRTILTAKNALAIWDSAKRHWRDVVYDLTDDELFLLYHCHLLTGFLRPDPAKGASTGRLSVLDFAETGAWRCETVTLWALHLLRTAGLRMNVVFHPGHVFPAIRTRAGDFIAYNNALTFQPAYSFSFAASQLDYKGNPKTEVLLPPYAALAAKIFNFSHDVFMYDRDDESYRNLVRQLAALTLYPDFPEAHFSLGITYLDRVNGKEAVTYLQKAIAGGLNDAMSYSHLGEAQRISAFTLAERQIAATTLRHAINLSRQQSDIATQEACFTSLMLLLSHPDNEKDTAIRELSALLAEMTNAGVRRKFLTYGREKLQNVRER